MQSMHQKYIMPWELKIIVNVLIALFPPRSCEVQGGTYIFFNYIFNAQISSIYTSC